MSKYESPEIFELGNAEAMTLASLSSNPADKCGACRSLFGLSEEECPEESS